MRRQTSQQGGPQWAARSAPAARPQSAAQGSARAPAASPASAAGAARRGSAGGSRRVNGAQRASGGAPGGYSGTPQPPATAAELAAELKRRESDVRRLENALVGAAHCVAFRQQQDGAAASADQQRAEDAEHRLADTQEQLRQERALRAAAEQRADALAEQLAEALRQRDANDQRLIADLREALRAEQDDASAVAPSSSVHSSPSASARVRFKPSRRGSEFNPSQPLVGFCNPLLDMSLRVDLDFLKRWGLEEDNACLADERNLPIFKEMADNDDVMYIPGGSGLNTLRVAQWILEAPGSAVFVGTTGKDAFGEKLHDTTRSECVSMPRCELSDKPTGTCAVLLTGNKRSLVANLGAGAVFEERWLREVPPLQPPVENAGLYYVTGFFLRTSPATVDTLAAMSKERKVELCLNLSAPFVVSGSADLFRTILPEVDLLFGNNQEAEALAQALGWEETEAQAIARRLQQWERAPGRPGHRTVVLTQGSGPVLVCGDQGSSSFETRKLPPEDLVDTNGAGDAFVGGFLAKRMRGGGLAECVRAGQWAATVIIGRPGCTLPPLPPGLLGDADAGQGKGGPDSPRTLASKKAEEERVQKRVRDRRPTLFPSGLKVCPKQRWAKLRTVLLGSMRIGRTSVSSMSGSMAGSMRCGTVPLSGFSSD